MRTLQKPSPRGVLLQIVKQLICIGMAVIVILPIQIGRASCRERV